MPKKIKQKLDPGQQRELSFRHNWRSLTFILLSISAIGLLSIIFYESYVFQNGDGAAWSSFVREIIHEKSLIPKTWNYSTQATWIGHHLLMLPFALFIKNSSLLHQISVLLSAGLIAFSLYYLNKKVLGGRLETVLFSGLLVLLGIGVFGYERDSSFTLSYADSVLGQGGYSSSIAFSLLLFALFVTLMEDDTMFSLSKPQKPKAIRLAVFLGGIFLLCSSSFMSFQYFIIPLCVALLWSFIDQNITSSERNPLRLVLTGSCTVVAGALGLLLHQILFVGVQYHQTVGVFRLEGNLSDKCKNLLPFFISKVFFFEPTETAFSLAAVFSLFRLVVGVLLTFVLPVLLFRRRKELLPAFRFFTIFSWSMFFVNLFILFFTDIELLPRYLLISNVYMWIMSAMYIQEFLLKKDFPFREMACIGMCALTIMFMIPRVQHARNSSIEMTNKKLLVRFLQKNDLKFGYGQNLAHNTVNTISNFEIELASVFPISNIQDPSARWLSSDRLFDPSYHEGRTFIVYLSSEYDKVVKSGALDQWGEIESVLSCAGNKIVVFKENPSQYWRQK